MLRAYAEKFVRLGEQLLDVNVGLFYRPQLNDGSQDPAKVLTAEEIESLRSVMREASVMCAELSLPVASKLFREAILDPPQTEREFGLLRKTFLSDLASRVFLAIDPNRTRYYAFPAVLTEAGQKAFPTAYEELLSASRAYALEMHTACVFHSMSALEPVLTVLAADVDESVGTDNWQNVIDRIEAKISAFGKSPRAPDKAVRLQFLSEAAKEFSYFKDAWRNHVAHGRGSYDQVRSHRVLEHVRTFVEHLSTRLHE